MFHLILFYADMDRFSFVYFNSTSQIFFSLFVHPVDISLFDVQLLKYLNVIFLSLNIDIFMQMLIGNEELSVTYDLTDFLTRNCVYN